MPPSNMTWCRPSSRWANRLSAEGVVTGRWYPGGRRDLSGARRPGYGAGMAALDFWVGHWRATWDGGQGTNTVTRELGGQVVVERFEAAGDEPFSGLSVSVEDPGTGAWRQTWVDSEGSYWAFEGGPQPDGTFVFGTPGPVDRDQVFKRMVFSNIAADSFDWRWEFSVDGVAWDQRWAIRYERR